jgi:rubrerythrin
MATGRPRSEFHTGVSVTVEEAIKTSIEYETRVRDVYRDAVRRAQQEDGKKLFQVMADEEQHHLDYLQTKLEEWSEKGEVTPEGLKTALPPANTIEAGIAVLEDKVGDGAGKIEIEFLEKALAVERETGDFYRRMVEELPGEAKEMFRRFLEIEDGHLALVQAQIDQVMGTGYWFDVQEFNLEAY